jgi:hypothetical protein
LEALLPVQFAARDPVITESSYTLCGPITYNSKECTIKRRKNLISWKRKHIF